MARIRRKRVELFGGNILSELLYAVSLGASCLAYGVNLNLAQLIFVNTSASVLSSVIPVPGGIGAAEAALSAGLISMGVDESTAFAIALTQRLCTFYLPPIWGYFSLRWLTQEGLPLNSAGQAGVWPPAARLVGRQRCVHREGDR